MTGYWSLTNTFEINRKHKQSRNRKIAKQPPAGEETLGRAEVY